VPHSHLPPRKRAGRPVVICLERRFAQGAFSSIFALSYARADGQRRFGATRSGRGREEAGTLAGLHPSNLFGE
jgi:hypothetical protein